MPSSNSPNSRFRVTFPFFFALLFTVFLALFFPVLDPSTVLFSNDGPLGAANAAYFRAPSSFLGVWYDLTSIGTSGGSYPLSLTGILFWALGPLYYAKFYAPLTLIFLGVCAWYLFRKLGFAPLACVVGGLAASLNSGFFCASCWGVGTHAVTVGASFLALGLLADPAERFRLLRTILAGLMIGFGVTEGADIGALFSMAIAAFVVYGAWFSEGSTGKRVANGVGRVALVACFAAFFAAQAVTTLIGTQIKGIAGTQQDNQTKQQHWDFSTQWSLPKREALGFAIPGLFGYRMDRADGGAYWGAVGRDPNWDRYFANGKQGSPPQGSMRFSGGGIYSGILVLVVAAWTGAQSMRKRDSVFSLPTRRWIWFWLAIFAVSLLLAFGRFAPFYQFLYALPYFSTIRNPAKFCYFCNWALVVLFAYGVNGLHKLYMENPSGKTAAARQGLKEWWRCARGFDRYWSLACGCALGAAALGWLIFASSRDAFEKYLQEVQFEPAMAHLIAGFTAGQVGIFLIFFAASILLVTLIISGTFRGQRAKWGGLLLGLLVVVDLGRANEPWIVTWDYLQKYASNPIIDYLRKAPYEHRVASMPRWLGQVFRLPPGLSEPEQYFRQLYGIEWTQHHFLYYNIQCLDIIQMPRIPEDLAAYDNKFFPGKSSELSRVSRHWQLTNTRYLLGAAGFLDFLNQQFDPAQRRFRIADRFNIVPKPGITRPTKLEELTAVTDTNGPFALFEFTGALPRAQLYTNWKVTKNDEAVLDELASPDFDPAKTLLMSASSGLSSSNPGTNQNPAEVKFSSYAPKDILLNATAPTQSVLLLNDRFDSDWKVFVDGRQETLLRCNFIMRGVRVPQGSHQIEFRFEPPERAFYVSLIAIGLTVLLWGIISIPPTSTRPEPASPRLKPSATPSVAAR
jgi:hypothetical protein